MRALAILRAKERAQFFRQYQQNRGIDSVIAEKDFWVDWLLGRILAQPELAECVFNEGTSLFKRVRGDRAILRLMERVP